MNARYWAAITLASVFGTNLGDLYAHTTHLGIAAGILVLCVFAAVVFVAERANRSSHETNYWLVIIIIRTGATNIADYLAFRVRIPVVVLVLVLAMLIGVLSWHPLAGSKTVDRQAQGMPSTDAGYWAVKPGSLAARSRSARVDA